MTKNFCDCCSKEIEFRVYKFSYLCHLDPSGKWNGYREGNEPVSGREIVKDLCLHCYNDIIGVAVSRFKSLTEYEDTVICGMVISNNNSMYKIKYHIAVVCYNSDDFKKWAKENYPKFKLSSHKELQVGDTLFHAVVSMCDLKGLSVIKVTYTCLAKDNKSYKDIMSFIEQHLIYKP